MLGIESGKAVLKNYNEEYQKIAKETILKLESIINKKNSEN